VIARYGGSVLVDDFFKNTFLLNVRGKEYNL
jgi:hypothetical protein